MKSIAVIMPVKNGADTIAEAKTQAMDPAHQAAGHCVSEAWRIFEHGETRAAFGKLVQAFRIRPEPSILASMTAMGLKSIRRSVLPRR